MKLGKDKYSSLITEDEIEICKSEAIYDLKPSKLRWLMLFIFSLNLHNSSVLYLVLSSISNITAWWYSVGQVSIEWTSTVFLVLTVVLLLPASYLLTRLGMRFIIVAGALFQFINSLLLYADSFPLAIVGQIFGAMASPLLIQSSSKLSSIWFPSNERGTATAISIVSKILGDAIGFILSSNIVKEVDSEDGFRYEFKTLFVVVIVLNGVTFLLTAIFFQEKPKAKKTILVSKDGDFSFFTSIKNLVLDQQFMIMCQAYSIYGGFCWCIVVVANSLLTKFFSDSYGILIGWMGFTYCITAGVGCLLTGLFVDRYKKYRETAIFLIVASLTLWIVFIVTTVFLQNFTASFIVFALFGMVSFPYFSVGLEQASEMTYPIPEQISSSFISMVACVYGFIFTFGFGFIIDLGYVKAICYCVPLLYLVAFIFSYSGKCELKRRNAELFSKEVSVKYSISNSSYGSLINTKINCPGDFV